MQNASLWLNDEDMVMSGPNLVSWNDRISNYGVASAPGSTTRRDVGGGFVINNSSPALVFDTTFTINAAPGFEVWGTFYVAFAGGGNPGLDDSNKNDTSELTVGVDSNQKFYGLWDGGTPLGCSTVDGNVSDATLRLYRIRFDDTTNNKQVGYDGSLTTTCTTGNLWTTATWDRYNNNRFELGEMMIFPRQLSPKEATDLSQYWINKYTNLNSGW